MTFDERLARSAALAEETSEAAVDAQRAVLADQPHHVAASIRLGRVLARLGRFDEAQAAFEAVLEHDPRNAIARRRLDGLPRLRNPPPAPVARRPRGPAPSGPGLWLKGVHYAGDGWTIAPGQTDFVSDIGRRRADGSRVYNSDGVAWGCPSWRVGDQIGLYFGGTLRVPVLVEVTAPPEFNPQRVLDRDGSAEDAERWPWVTDVRGLYNKPLEEAPTLDELGISSDRVQRLSRATIDADLHARIVAALSA